MEYTTLNRLARRYPTLDLQSLQILALVADWQGVTMADLAEELDTTHHYYIHPVPCLHAGPGQKRTREKRHEFAAG
ncbi:hypothetical protein [Endozoicomonas sp. NE40]|uniref:HTH marR-type domain-containing protein n=1 Tax=Endozoicomonas lisbonensis TaxID=3120522 RepID=A0ABV2SJ63_9GAMM